MTPGVLYSGTLPPPSATAPSSSKLPVVPATATLADQKVTASPQSRVIDDWYAVSKFVAARALSPADSSALLARGSTLAAPRWVPCGSKPVAALINLEAVAPSNSPVPGKIVSVLEALETLDVKAVYITRRTGADLATSLAALSRAGLVPPAPGAGLFQITPSQEASVRATVGTRYCIVAIVGDRPEDFPNGADPVQAGQRWPEGWFLVPKPGAIAK